MTAESIFSMFGKIIDSKIMGKENGKNRLALQPSKNDFAVHDFVKRLAATEQVRSFLGDSDGGRN
jgi:hypothetical protein